MSTFESILNCVNTVLNNDTVEPVRHFPRVFKRIGYKGCSAFNVSPMYEFRNKYNRVIDLPHEEIPCNICLIRSTCRNRLLHGWVSELNDCEYFENYITLFYKQFIKSRYSGAYNIVSEYDALPPVDCIGFKAEVLKGYVLITHRLYFNFHKPQIVYSMLFDLNINFIPFETTNFGTWFSKVIKREDVGEQMKIRNKSSIYRVET